MLFPTTLGRLASSRGVLAGFYPDPYVRAPAKSQERLTEAGDVILVACQFTGSMPCPVCITERFLHQGRHSPGQHVHLLGKVTSACSGSGMRSTMSYSRATGILKLLVGRTQTDPTPYVSSASDQVVRQPQLTRALWTDCYNGTAVGGPRPPRISISRTHSTTFFLYPHTLLPPECALLREYILW